MEHDTLEEVTISEFNAESLRDKFGFYLILGKRNTGKTTWCTFLNQFVTSSKEGTVIVITDNDKLAEAWSKFVPKLYIYQPGDDDILKKINENQNNVMYSVRNHAIHNKKYVDNTMSLTLILDDVGCHDKIMNNKYLAKLASTGRHNHVTVFILAQYIYQVKTRVRSQFDRVFMLNTADDKSIKTVHKEFMAMTNINMFKSILSEVTRSYGMMIINTNAPSSLIGDTCEFATIPADWMENFQACNHSDRSCTHRLGRPNQWKFSDEHYTENVRYKDLCRTGPALENNSDEDKQKNRDEGRVRQLAGGGVFFSGKNPFTLRRKFLCDLPAPRDKKKGDEHCHQTKKKKKSDSQNGAW